MLCKISVYLVIEWPEKSNQNSITQHGGEEHVVEVAWRQEVTREGCAREDLVRSVSHQGLKEVMVLISWKRRKDSSARAAGTTGKQGRLSTVVYRHFMLLPFLLLLLIPQVLLLSAGLGLWFLNVCFQTSVWIWPVGIFKYHFYLDAYYTRG